MVGKPITLKKIKKIIKNYTDLLQKDGWPIQKVILFGSYAKGNANQYSDIDICLVSPKFGKDYIEETQYLHKKIWQTDSRLEPVAFNPRDFAEDENPFVWEIKKTGIRII